MSIKTISDNVKAFTASAAIIGSSLAGLILTGADNGIISGPVGVAIGSVSFVGAVTSGLIIGAISNHYNDSVAASVSGLATGIVGGALLSASLMAPTLG